MDVRLFASRLMKDRPAEEPATPPEPPPAARLGLVLSGTCFPFFLPLLQKGARIRVRVGGSLAALLGEQFGLAPEYVRDRIKTVFLEGKPVDDLEHAPVRDGAALALSAAMPGLAGATLRRGGRLAALRAPITYRETGDSPPPADGFIVLKLFNLLLRDLGPRFLRQGIYLEQDELGAFLKGLPGEFWAGCREARLEGRILAGEEFRAREWLPLHPLFLVSAEFTP